MLCASLTPDSEGQDMMSLARETEKRQVQWVVAGWPRGAEVERGLAAMPQPHTQCTFDVVTSWYGDRTARRRTCLVLRRGEQPGDVDAFRQHLRSEEVARAEKLAAILLPLDALEDGL